jgi:integrase
MKRRGLPRWCDEYKNRHGKWTVRFRRKGWRTIYPKARPGTDEFADEYRRWLAGQPVQARSKRALPDSLRALSTSFFNSIGFRLLRPSTQSIYRNAIERLCEETDKEGRKYGDKSAATMQREHVVRLMAAKAEKPDSANLLRKVLRAMMQHAVETGLRKDDPTRDVRAIRVKTDGYHSWTDAEIEQFEKRHEIGTRARLAQALLLYTRQRRSDVVRMGRQHVRDGVIDVRQMKGGAFLQIPIHATLAKIISQTPSEHLTYLTTQFGKPFTSAGFGNWFRERCDEATLAHCTAHGLRKAAARRLAEAGCTAHEIAAITGHASLREVQRYTKAVDQTRLAASAMNKVRTSIG